MRKKGKIISFNKFHGWGNISYESSIIKFYALDVSNYQNIRMQKGQNVEFDIVNFLGKNRPINILIKSKNKKSKITGISGIVKYNYENWEEIEKLVEGDYGIEETPIRKSASLKTDTSFRNKSIDKDFVALALFGNKIKIVSLTKDGRYSFLDKARKYHNILYPSFIQEADLEVAIEEFEDLINSSKAGEKHFQEFFERNPKFILNDEYKKAHPHIILAKEDKKKLIPDFVLEPVNQNEFCDLLELKLPSAQIYVMKKNREHYSAAITEAAAQLRVYGNFFNEEKNRKSFQRAYPHLKIYKPRMFVIIGRQSNENSMIKREIQAEHPQLILRNFDDLLARMKWKKEKIADKNNLFR